MNVATKTFPVGVPTTAVKSRADTTTGWSATTTGTANVIEVEPPSNSATVSEIVNGPSLGYECANESGPDPLGEKVDDWLSPSERSQSRARLHEPERSRSRDELTPSTAL